MLTSGLSLAWGAAGISGSAAAGSAPKGSSSPKETPKPSAELPAALLTSGLSLAWGAAGISGSAAAGSSELPKAGESSSAGTCGDEDGMGSGATSRCCWLSPVEASGLSPAASASTALASSTTLGPPSIAAPSSSTAGGAAAVCSASLAFFSASLCFFFSFFFWFFVSGWKGRTGEAGLEVGSATSAAFVVAAGSSVFLGSPASGTLSFLTRFAKSMESLRLVTSRLVLPKAASSLALLSDASLMSASILLLWSSRALRSCSSLLICPPSVFRSSSSLLSLTLRKSTSFFKTHTSFSVASTDSHPTVSENALRPSTQLRVTAFKSSSKDAAFASALPPWLPFCPSWTEESIALPKRSSTRPATSLFRLSATCLSAMAVPATIVTSCLIPKVGPFAHSPGKSWLNFPPSPNQF